MKHFITTLGIIALFIGIPMFGQTAAQPMNPPPVQDMGNPARDTGRTSVKTGRETTGRSSGYRLGSVGRHHINRGSSSMGGANRMNPKTGK
jgi:hypothetical protein